MAAPSESGRSFLEGMQDDMVDRLTRTVNIISSFFELLDLDKNGSVELSDLHRMQVGFTAWPSSLATPEGCSVSILDLMYL